MKSYSMDICQSIRIIEKTIDHLLIYTDIINHKLVLDKDIVNVNEFLLHILHDINVSQSKVYIIYIIYNTL